MINKPKILIFTDWYVPGFKAGGPIKSLKNLVSDLQSEFEIYVFTSDRDLGDEKSYPELEIDKWVKLECHNVFYCSPENHSSKLIRRQHKNINPDIVYINGVFSNKYSIMPLLKLRKKAKKIVVSPRGMFNSGALGLKSKKKKAFIRLAKIVKLYKGINWHVTSEGEKDELNKVVGNDLKISLIKNIVSNPSLKSVKKSFDDSQLKLVFVGRICKVKNINFLVDVLNKVDLEKEIFLDIIGSVEDEKYWNYCKSKIDVSKKYKINLLGELPSNEISEELSKYDFFISPTLNENFGHAIVEAMQAGLPLIISDQTPWRGLDKFNAGFDLSLNDQLWVDKLETLTKFSATDYAKYKQGIELYYSTQFNMTETHRAYVELFS